jgi:hypothetical protein
MPKTKRDLLHALADKIGGDQGERLRALLQRKTMMDDILDRPLSEEEFAAQLQKLQQGIPQALERIQGEDWMKSGEWGNN